MYMLNTTFRTSPVAFMQWHFRHFIFTTMAGLRTSKPLVKFYQMNTFFCCLVLHSFLMKLHQPTSPIALARLWFFIILAVFSVSTITAWLSSTIAQESLCQKSARALATRSCNATRQILAFLRFALPFFLRGKAFCLRRRL